MSVSLTLRYVPPEKVAEYEKKGWHVVNDLKWCHHGQHAVVMQKGDPQFAPHHQRSALS